MNISLPQFNDSNLLTHSATKCWNSCRRRFYFAYILGIRRAYSTEPLRLGNLWHLGVGLYEGGTSIDDTEGAIRDAYAQQDRPPYFTDEEYQVEEEKVVAMVRAHHARYAGDPILKTIAIEIQFNVAIRNPATGYPTPSFVDAGKIDRIAQLPDDTIAIVERKTTSESIDVSAPYWKALRNDPQISRYFRAARALGHDVTKVVYDVVKKPAIRPKDVAKKDQAYTNSVGGTYHGLKLGGPCPDHETPKMYGARLFADMLARPDFYFARVEIARLDSDLEEFAQDQWFTQQEIQQAKTNGRFYRNPASCLEPYTCEYIDVCAELHSDPEHVPSGFRRVTRLHEELEETKEVSNDTRTPEPAAV